MSLGNESAAAVDGIARWNSSGDVFVAGAGKWDVDSCAADVAFLIFASSKIAHLQKPAWISMFVILTLEQVLTILIVT
jgi:hypothetical protein